MFVFVALVAIALQTVALRPISNHQLSRSKFQLRPSAVFIPSSTQLQASEGLSADALNALGNIPEVSGSDPESVTNISASVGSILVKLTASPLIVAVPILAGAMVAFGIGFFIYWYGRGGE